MNKYTAWTPPLQPFPLCRLHGRKIIDELPRGCPLAAPHPLDAIARAQDRGFALLATRPDRPSLGLGLIERTRTCDQCIGRLIGHPRIEWLRANIREGPAPQPRPTPKARPEPVPSPRVMSFKGEVRRDA